MTKGSDVRQPRGRISAAELLLSSIAAVSWAFLAMAGISALGLHLLGADTAGALGPMTAAVVVLAVGGSVTPSGAVEAFGLKGAAAHTAIEIAPLGVSLAGALLLGTIFARSLRSAGATVRAGELVLRMGAVAVLFLLLLGGLAWAGEDSVTIDGAGLGLGGTGGGTGGGPGPVIPGIGDLGNIGGLPDRLAGLADAKASVGFSVRTGPSLAGGAGWVLGVLLITLLAARRAPLPRGWELLHRSVRPAVSALCAVLVLAVGAGLAAALYAAASDDHPGRVLGAALLGAPNGVWLGLPLGMLVPWRGTATGALARMLPSPLDELLTARMNESVTLGRLAELDPRVWLLAVGCALLMLAAGVLTAVRTPRGALTPARFAARCAVALGAATAVALPVLVLVTRVRVDAGLSVLGFDAFGAGLDLRGSVPAAVGLGAVWGAGAGAAGGLLAFAAGAAGRRATRFAPGHADSRTYPALAYLPGPYNPSPVYRPAHDDTNPYKRPDPRQPLDDRSSAPTQTGRPVPPLRPRRRSRGGYAYGTSMPDGGPPPPGPPPAPPQRPQGPAGPPGPPGPPPGRR
ncbi:streptophobe family protein [Streptomyces albireticuli]|uniref:streptophobe family protein n=1 Tax=Streptomyces albireticuli TaxID=1940 RepID=UPI001B80290C|nr:streptophobe family protein [Streptomyces albireticuli]MCD9142366.1 streptophobe family protein [Streptomyces albireticuli]MCD9162380.1 streptophobe family protein [Streptomyces albireticuli]MCD9190540.1 streptophobe family protein [Streptomyces albireticuli]